MQILRRVLSLDAAEYVGTVKEDQAKTDEANILEALTDEWQDVESIASATNLPEGTVRTRCKRLYETDRIDRTGKGVKKDPYTWRKIHSAQDIPLSAETNFHEDGGDSECQTFDL